jgi:ATP-dependent helicase HrpB
VTDSADLNWLDRPPDGALAQARELLRELDALDTKHHITPSGRQMLEMSLHPRLARMMLEAKSSGQIERAADLAALLTERDIVRSGPTVDRLVDIATRLDLLQAWRSKEKASIAAAGADPSACARVDRLSRQLGRSRGRGPNPEMPPASDGALLASAYPDRIAQRRKGSDGRYLLASGRGVRLPAGDPLGANQYLVVASLDAGRSEGRIYLAAGIELTQIRQTQSRRIVKSSVLIWDADSRAVVAREEERLGSLLLRSRASTKADPEAVCAALLQGIRGMGPESLPWDVAAREWQARLLSLRCWQPEAGWPDLSDEGLFNELELWLAPWLNGISSHAQLKRIDLKSILKNQLDWERQQRLEELAPTHVRVPSGSRKRLSYQPGEPPVLKVKLQEMFGLGDTPTVCAGQVPVVLHLLSPAQRPIQVTQDLKGFWERTYQQVKRELKGRYPKHYWPDDPWQAQPTARLRPASE